MRAYARLKPSTSDSRTHLSISSATCSGVPMTVAPRPPILIWFATVCLVHLGTPGLDLDHPSTAELVLLASYGSSRERLPTEWHCWARGATYGFQYTITIQRLKKLLLYWSSVPDSTGEGQALLVLHMICWKNKKVEGIRTVSSHRKHPRQDFPLSTSDVFKSN